VEKIIIKEKTMFDNATLNQLRDLRLSVMAEGFKEQQNKKGINSLTFEERFALLVESEWLHRKNKRIERLVKQARFRFPAIIEDVDWYSKKGVQKPEILKHSLGGYIKKAQNIIFCGPTGVGKTYLACALGHAACTQSIQVIYIRLSNYFERIFNDYEGEYKNTWFRDKCATVPLLILDDWGLRKFSTEETDELSDLFERRYARVSTIISSQIPSTSWHELFSDPTQADSTLDRVIHNAYLYSITGESMRKTIGKRSLESQDI